MLANVPRTDCTDIQRHTENRRVASACQVIERAGAPDTIRTCDLCLRRATLYPAELRVRCASFSRLARHRQWPREAPPWPRYQHFGAFRERQPILILSDGRRPVAPKRREGLGGERAPWQISPDLP